MSILNLGTIRTLVRSNLNETTTTPITDTELNSIANDGYINVAVKGLCYEQKIAVNNIPSNVDLIPLDGYNIVRVNYIEYSSPDLPLAMMSVNPQTIGHMVIDGSSPQFWFQWGNYVKIEPLPDTSTYDLNLFVSCYPAIPMIADTDVPSLIPAEFHECVFLYTLAFSCMKLRRWNDAINYYNRFTESIQKEKSEYYSKFAEVRANLDLSNKVNKTGK